MADPGTMGAADWAADNRRQQHGYGEKHARKVGFEGAFHTPIVGRATGVCAMRKGNFSRRHVGSFRNFLFSRRRTLQVPAATVSQHMAFSVRTPWSRRTV